VQDRAVDDNGRFLHVACALLEREGIDVVGVASTSAEAVQRAEELRPDVALVDVCLGAECGFDLAREVRRTGSTERPDVIMISTYTACR
jgi:CheY-like chemotaxis protein